MKRVILAAVLMLIAFVFGHFLSEDNPSRERGETGKRGTRASFVEGLESALIVVPDFGKMVRLTGGRAEFPLEEDDPEGPKGLIVLARPTARVNATEGSTGRARDYVFCIATLSGGGDGVFRYLVMFEDAGKGPSFIATAFIGDRIEVLDMNVNGGWDEAGSDLRIRMRILDRLHGEMAPTPPSTTKMVTFRVRRSDDTITRETDE